MNIAGYPYAIAKLHMIIRKEKSFLSKYFLALDLFDVTIKYLYFIAVNCLNNNNFESNNDINFALLKKIIKSNTSSSVSVLVKSLNKEINNPEHHRLWEKINNFEELKNQELVSPLESEEYYKSKFKQTFALLEEIISGLSFIKNYEIVVPVKYDETKNKLEYISLGSLDLELKATEINSPSISKDGLIISKVPSKIDFNSLYLKNNSVDKPNTSARYKVIDANGEEKSIDKPKIIENDILINKKNEWLKLNKINLNAINYRINYNPEKSAEELINSFHRFIMNNNYISIKLNFIRLEAKNLNENTDFKPDLFIERPYINNRFDSFLKVNNSGYLFIVGSLGSGKSTTVKNYIKDIKSKNFIVTKIKDNVNYDKNFEEIIKDFNQKYDISLDHSKKIETQNHLLRLLNQICRLDDKHIIIFEDINILDDANKFLALFPEKLPPNIYIFFTMSARESLTLPRLENKDIYYLPNFSYEEIKKICEKSFKDNELITDELINDIYKKSYGLPLYVMLEISKLNSTASSNNVSDSLESYLFNLLLSKSAEDFLDNTLNNSKTNYKSIFVEEPHKKIELLELKFNELVNSLEDFMENYQSELKKYVKYFLALLADSTEGYNKVEIKNILAILPMPVIEHIIDRSGEFLIKINGRYKLSYYIYEKIILDQLSSEEVIFIQNKIIDFFEPWDKKVSSLSLKYLPQHYVKADRIDDLKNLLCTNFVKAKFKIYPQETLNDFISFINYLTEAQPENIADITKFCFIYQKLKEEYKKELLNVVHLSHSNKYNDIIKKVDYINKPMEKFYQFLLVSNLAADNKNPVESRTILKTLLEIPEVFINQSNSELIFRLCADISSAGVLDIISIPRTREDGSNLIKYLTETAYIGKVLEVLIKLLEAIPGEIDRAVLLEALMNKVADFKNSTTVDKFFQEILPLIEKVKNINIKDRLFYVYISSILKKPDLYSKHLNNILEMKEKIETSLFKFLFYGNLALLFLNMKQEKISKDFIIRAISFISDLENLNHQSFMFNSMISGFKYFEKTYFFDELIEYAFSIINEASFNYEKIERSLSLLNQVKNYDKTAEILKSLVKDFSRINEKSTQPLLKPFIQVLSKITDKRVRNPILKKITNIADSENIEYKINFYSLLLLIIKPDDETFNLLVDYIDFNSTEIAPEKILDLITTNILSFSGREYSEKLFEFVLKNISFITNEETVTNILIKITDILGKAKFNKTREHIGKISTINSGLSSKFEQIRGVIYLTFLYANLNDLNSSIDLLNLLFIMIIKEDDENRYLIISEIFKNINHIKDNNRLNQYLTNLLKETYNLLAYMKKEDYVVKIITDIFTFVTKLHYPELKNIFYKALEITNSIVNANNRENVIGIIRLNLPVITEKNYLIDILQKSILISEENFSQGNIRLLSLVEIAVLNEKFGRVDVAQRLMRSVIAELRFFNFEEYSSDVIVHISQTLSKFADKNIAIELFKNLNSAENSLQSDKIISRTYAEMSHNLTKIGDFEATLPIFASILDKSIKIKNETIKTDFLIRIISNITTFGFSELTNEFIKKIYEMKNVLKEEENLVNFYKSFIISLNKLNNLKIITYLDTIEADLDSINDTALKTDLLSLLAIAYFKYKNIEKSDSLFEQATSMTQRIENVDKKVNLSIMLFLKLFSAKQQEQGKTLIDAAIKAVNKIADENHRFELVMKIIGNFQQLNTIKGYKSYFYNIFESLTNFKSPINLIRIYMLLGETYFKLGEFEYSEYYYQQAVNKANTEETYEAIEYRINLGISLIQNNNKLMGNEVLSKVLDSIKNKPKRVFSELIIKLFHSLITIGEKQYNRVFFNDVIQNLEKLTIRELNENELYKLAYTYAYKNQPEKFKYVLKFLKNKVLIDKLLNSIIDIFINREDSKNLMGLIVEVINDSKNLDRILASLLSFTLDSEQTKKITDTIIIY